MRRTNWRRARGTIKREAFGDKVVDTITEHIPNIKKIIVGRQVLTPLDLEREFGLTQGNIFQGELSLEQLFFLRPVPGWAYYSTPVENLYMCGSATHPGGGIMGAPGRIASTVILKDWKKAVAPRDQMGRNPRSRQQAPRVTAPAETPHGAAASETVVATAPEIPTATDDDSSVVAPDSEKN